MSRRFSTREKVMLCILAVLVVAIGYYKFVWQYSQTGVQEAEERRIAADDQLIYESARAANLSKMRGELDVLLADGADSVTEIEEYDNIQNVMKILNTALSKSTSYDLSFNEIQFDSTLARRVIDMNFTCPSYAAAKNIIRELYGCHYRCQIGALTISADSGEELPDVASGKVSVSMSVTFFESVVGQAVAVTEEETPAA